MEETTMTRSLILALVFLGSAPPAFAGWQALGTVPTPADAGEYPFDYALGADGTAAVAWCSVTPQGVRAEATIRSRNAKGFGKVKSFATLPHRYYGGCAQVDVEVAADGTVALLWSHGDLRLKLATKPAGKPWSRAAIVAEDAGGGASDFALGPDAGVWVVWSGNQNRVIRVRHQP
jgi:hypothetical protein